MTSLQEAMQTIRALALDRDQARELARQSIQRAETLTKLIDGYVELFPELAFELVEYLRSEIIEVKEDPPRGQVAVFALLSAFPGRFMTVAEIQTAMEQQGWLPETDNPAAAIRAALQRLVLMPDAHIDKRGDRSSGVTWGHNPQNLFEEDELDPYEPDVDDFDRMDAAIEEKERQIEEAEAAAEGWLQ